MNLAFYIEDIAETIKIKNTEFPWIVIRNIIPHLNSLIDSLDESYQISDGIAIHKSAIIENNVTLKGPVIISENCFIGSNAYLRGGVYLGSGSRIGPACEIKSSIIMKNSATAHFNFIGDSIIGNNVNFEAGSIVANHYNERPNKMITVFFDLRTFETGVEKFGGLVGDNSKIGANAVLSPGTILNKNSVVKRLELIDQSILQNGYDGRGV